MSKSRPRKIVFGELEQLEQRQMFTSNLLTVAPDVGWRCNGETDVLCLQTPYRDSFAVTEDSENNVLEVHQPLTFLPYHLHEWRSDNRIIHESKPELVAVTSAKNGSVGINADGKLVYTPNQDYIGTDQFTYTVLAFGAKVNVSASVEVVFPFVAAPDWHYVQQNSEPTPIDVLSNDIWNLSEIRGKPNLTISAVTACDHGGTIAITADGKSITYTPREDFTGLAELEYTAVDQHGNKKKGSVQIRVGEDAYDPDSATHFRYVEEFVHYQISEELANANHLYIRPWYGFHRIAEVVPAADLATTANLTAFAAQGLNFSDTNVQVSDVDEADLVETDGEQVYWLSEKWEDGETVYELVILNAKTSDEAGVIASVRFEAIPKAMFLHEGRLTVITQQNSGNVGVTVLDVSDPTSPDIVENNIIDGQYDDARMVNGKLYLFAQSSNSYGRWGRCLFCYSSYPGRGLTIQDTLNWANNQTWLPGVTSENRQGETTFQSYVDVTTIRKGDQAEGFETAIFVFDTTDELVGVSSSTMLDFDPETIYMDADSIHLTSTNTGIWTGALQVSSDNQTNIHSYSLGDGGLMLEFQAAGTLMGSVANQFAMDEHEGKLRVATNDGRWQGETGSSVHVLEVEGKTWKEIGRVDGLAPGEQLYSTRFVEDRAYLVTFERVDPLHVIDLSDPTNPVELGELIIPGYSDYLHPISEDLVIGLGRSASPDGFFGGLQISLFDVSEPTNPKRLHNYVLEGERSKRFFGKDNPWSIGDLDHHAFSYFTESGILALPVYDDSDFGQWPNFGRLGDFDVAEPTGGSEIQLFKVDVDGIELIGKMEFSDRAERTVQVGDVIYGLSKAEVKGVHVDDPYQVVVDFDIESKEPALTVSIPEWSPASSASCTSGLSNPTAHETPVPIELGENSETHSTAIAEVSELPSSSQGDANTDGKVDSGDIDHIFAMLGTDDESSDINDDGQVDRSDVTYLIEDLLQSKTGDLNLDGKVGYEDFKILSANFGRESGWKDGDLNGDGKANYADFLLLSANFGD